MTMLVRVTQGKNESNRNFRLEDIDCIIIFLSDLDLKKTILIHSMNIARKLIKT